MSSPSPPPPRRDGLWGLGLAATAGALGLLLSPALWPVWVWGWGLPPAVGLAWWGRARRWRGGAWPLAVLLGAGWASLHAGAALAHRWPLAAFDTPVTWRVQVLAPPRVVENQSPFRVRAARDGTPPPPDRTLLFEVAPTTPADGRSGLPPGALRPRKLAVAWYRTDARVGGGECWWLDLRVKAPHGAASPGAPDAERQVIVNGIDARATVVDGRPCGVAGGWRAGLARLRQRGGDAVARRLPGHRLGAAYVRALLFGLDDGFSPADWAVFRATGTTHLVVVSGGNVALVSGLCYWLGAWLWSAIPGAALRLPAFRVGAVAALAGAVGQTALAGFEPPVARALVVVAALWLAGLAGRRLGAARGLLFAWLVLLAVDPLALLGASMWLSFGACAAIAWWLGGRLVPRPVRGWRRWGRRGGLVLRLQLGLSLLMAPLTLFFFGGVAGPGVIANLLAVPLFALMTPAVLGAMALLPVGLGPLAWCAVGFERFHAGLQWLAAAWPLPWLAWSASVPVLLAWLAGVLLLTLPRGIPLRGAGPVLLAAGVLGGVRAPVPPGRAEIAVLDVGQGLSVVVRTRAHSLLFDTGPGPGEAREGATVAAGGGGADAGAAVVVPALRELGVRRLDLLVVSHPDLDHAGGAGAVVAAYPRAVRVGSGGIPCREGERWAWDGVDFAFLSPGAATDLADDNEAGCVLMVRVGAHAVLLPADIQKRTEARLIADYGATGGLRADLVVAPHHGSSTSSTEAFVRAVAPGAVVYAAGWRNRFRHPRPDVVRRYRALGAQERLTGHAGTLFFRLSGAGVAEYPAWRVAHRHWWTQPVEPVPDADASPAPVRVGTPLPGSPAAPPR